MKNKRILYLALSGVIALSLIVGGVFAWFDGSQHRSNIMTGGNLLERNDVVLVEDFEEPDDWTEGSELTKNVWVRNTGDGQIFVRLQLKEYMDISKITYTRTTEYLLLDSDGRFVSANTQAALVAWLNANMPTLVYDVSQIQSFTPYGETAPRYFLVTNEHTNLHGKYGKQMLTGFNQTAPRSLVEGVVRGSYNPVPGHNNLECLYTPHLWFAPDIEDCEQGECADGFGFHDYVEWTLGDSTVTGDAVILKSDWIAAGAEPVAKWILDDDCPEGWAYWGEALRPGGRTSMLLESVTLIKQPEGPFYYAIHVDMQAASIYQLSAFTGMPQEIADALRGNTGFAISPNAQTAAQGGSVTFRPTWNGTAIPANTVTWSVVWDPTNTNTGHLGSLTTFNTPGVLTIGPGQPHGRLIVTATHTPAGSTARTQQFVITIR